MQHTRLISEHCIEGYHCEIKANLHLGVLLGYVDIPAEHELYGISHTDDRFPSGLMVHGGITYSEQHGDFWRLGFDCAHHGDFVPAFRMALLETSYKDEDYVLKQLVSLVFQIQHKELFEEILHS